MTEKTTDDAIHCAHDFSAVLGPPPVGALTGGEVAMLRAWAEDYARAKNSLLSAAARRLLAGLDALDRGCENEAPGFRGWHNGHGEEVGDEAQDAREALARMLEGPNAANKARP